MADLTIKVQTETLRVVDPDKTLAEKQADIDDFLLSHPDINQQALLDRIGFLLGSIDPRKREGTGSLSANKYLLVTATEAAPFFTVSTAEEAG